MSIVSSKNVNKIFICLDLNSRVHELGHGILQHLRLFRWFADFPWCAHARQQERLRTDTTSVSWQAGFFHQIDVSIHESPKPFEIFGRRIVVSVNENPPVEADLTWMGPVDTGLLIRIVSFIGWDSCERERTCVDCGMTLIHEQWHRGLDGVFDLREAFTLAAFTESLAFQTLFLNWWCQQFFTLTDNLRHVLDALQRIQELLHPTDHFCAAALRDGSWHLLHGAHPPDSAATARGVFLGKRRTCSTVAA